MRAFPLILFAALGLAGACGKETSAAADPLAGMKLDGDKRWQADDHTRQSIQAMVEEMRTADAEPGVTNAALAERLQGHLDKLFAGCTMQGAAHEALHTYLSVLIPQVDAMRQSDPAAATRARGEVGLILRGFAKYFA